MAYLGMVVTAHFNLFFAHLIVSRFRPIAFYFFLCAVFNDAAAFFFVNTFS